MLDYAANGHYYWEKGKMRDLAEKNAFGKGLSLEDAVQSLQPVDGLGVDGFFQRVEDNLREGQVRLVFFLEESSMELRSVVDFLNKQMERSEVLIVEARQYQHEGTRIVVPTLFGYTEEARQVKRTVTVTSGSRRKWDQESFFADASAKLDEAGVSALRRLYDACVSFSDKIRWGTGKTWGSFSPVADNICTGSILTTWSNGDIAINFYYIAGSDHATTFRDDLADFVASEFNLKLPEDWVRKFPTIKFEEWSPKADIFIEGLKQLVQKYRGIE